MSELMTSLDVVNQAFKKTMRGYDPAEVDEFLDRVAECLQVYAQKTKDYERELEIQLEKLADYERLKDSLHEALLMAQKTAEERISNATGMADSIVTEARSKAESLVSEARTRADGLVRKGEEDAASMARELEKLESMRASGFAAMKDFMGQMSSAISGAEADGRLHLPDFARSLASRLPAAPAPEPGGEAPKKIGITETLTALGIDPKLLETDPTK